MTSQGVGAPFGKGETIYGYQACGLTGTSYIGVGGPKEEYITNISQGDSAVFRYVQANGGFSKIAFQTEGIGDIEIYLNDVQVGVAEIKNNTTILPIKDMDDNQKELRLVLKNPKNLKLITLTLS